MAVALVRLAVHGDGDSAAAGLIGGAAGRGDVVRAADAFGGVGAADFVAPGGAAQPLGALVVGGGQRSHLVRAALVEQVPQGGFLGGGLGEAGRDDVP